VGRSSADPANSDEADGEQQHLTTVMLRLRAASVCEHVIRRLLYGYFGHPRAVTGRELAV
jgi:hypothetical protein